MKTLSLLAFAVLVVMFAASFPPTQARAVTCEELLDTLRTDTDAAASPLSTRDRNALLAKVDEASDKLALGKLSGALAKLEDHEAKLIALHNAPKPKISEADFATLSGDVSSAIACVEGLIASS